jgi:uncharacterized protein (TIGR00299 family) protein
MALGALVDAGADPAEVRALCARLPLDGWDLTFEPVLRAGLAATKAHVHAEETTVLRTAAHILGLINEARLPDRVTRRALATFELLAEVEGALHRRPPSQVHFHEVGAIDSIIDIVGTCAALEVLGIDELHASPVATGRGVVRSAHGLIPNPAPAVVRLLAGAPTYGVETSLELTTPTGAALLAALAVGWGPMPPMVIDASGFGAGGRDTDGRPNTTQVVLGTRVESLERGQPVTLLEANVDDATGETLADAVAALLAAGAHDAWLTPIVMKKGRPAYVVSVLADTALAGALAQVLRDTTGTLGVRGQTFERWPAARTIDEVSVDGRPVRVKVGAGRVKVEHDDAARVARLSGRPVREVVSLAEEAWRRRGDAPNVVQIDDHREHHTHTPPEGHDHGHAHPHEHPHDHGHSHAHPHAHDDGDEPA